MFKRIIALAGMIILCSVITFAQNPSRFEVSGFGGYSLNDGVSGGTVTAGDNRTYNSVDPKDGGMFGGAGEYLFSDHAGVGFMYSRVSSNLKLGGVGGTPDKEVGGMAISNYHGTIGYTFGEDGHAIRPFIYAGFGATNFGSTDFSFNGQNRTVQGHSKFSTQWGGGLKYFVTPKVAIRGAVAWIPTYIKTDTTGYWCDPFWGCYLTGDAQYSNQFQFTGGVSFRF